MKTLLQTATLALLLGACSNETPPPVSTETWPGETVPALVTRPDAGITAARQCAARR